MKRWEKETILNYNEEEAKASVFTYNGALMRKLAKLAEERPEDCRKVKTVDGGRAAEYVFPKRWIRIRPNRILTEEQKAAINAQLHPKTPLLQGVAEQNGVGVG